MSANGQYIVAVVTGDHIYTSSDSGANWTSRDSSRGWYAVDCSGSGQYMVAAAK